MEICSICHYEIDKKECILICGHKFHLRCIKIWFKISYHCPLCRSLNDYYILKNKGIEYYNLYIILKHNTFILFNKTLTEYINDHKKEFIYVLNHSDLQEIIKTKYFFPIIQLCLIYNSNYLFFKNIIKYDDLNYKDIFNNSYLMIGLKNNICNKKLNYLLRNNNLNIINVDNENALLLALRYKKNKKIIKFLIKNTNLCLCNFYLKLKIKQYLFAYINYDIYLYIKKLANICIINLKFVHKIIIIIFIIYDIIFFTLLISYYILVVYLIINKIKSVSYNDIF